MANRKAPALEAAHNEVKRLWIAMCEHDGIQPGANFVVFSDQNPYAAAYNEAMTIWMRLRKAQKARAARRDAIESLGMKEVRGALGGGYIE